MVKILGLSWICEANSVYWSLLCMIGSFSPSKALIWSVLGIKSNNFQPWFDPTRRNIDIEGEVNQKFTFTWYAFSD